MPYAILRFQKRKAGGVAACERHNERKKEAYKSNPDIDMERSKDNYHLVNPPRYTYKKEINRMVAEAGCRTRKDSVMMVETLITASPEFMNSLPPKEQKAYFTMALDFISERVGEKNILSAVVHMDERTPHMHLCFVPITPDNKLSAKTILGNQKSLSEWQTAYHERMSSRWNQLERGQSSMETKRKHVPTWLYKLGGRLDKQYEEIVSALSDINAFNAGKKRDKALELIAAWLPDVEKFSKEISKQSAYINSLKEQIGQESDYAGRMRDEKYEQELKVQKANQKIFELQRTNEQIGFVGELHITPTKRWTALKPKNCTVCGVEYVPSSGISKYCPACAKRIQREKSNESKRRSRERNRRACIELSAKNDRLTLPSARAVSSARVTRILLSMCTAM